VQSADYPEYLNGGLAPNAWGTEEREQPSSTSRTNRTSNPLLRRCDSDSFWPPNKATAASAAITASITAAIVVRSVVHRHLSAVVVVVVRLVVLQVIILLAEVAGGQQEDTEPEPETEAAAVPETEVVAGRTAAATAIPRRPSRCTAVA